GANEADDLIIFDRYVTAFAADRIIIDISKESAEETAEIDGIAGQAFVPQGNDAAKVVTLHGANGK
ncbi:hypothetical protein HUU40_21330, partial [candidate division KSB1 bacterium]|nr:hypothetical protein [candidate division KSB1 bacterium]